MFELTLICMLWKYVGVITIITSIHVLSNRYRYDLFYGLDHGDHVADRRYHAGPATPALLMALVDATHLGVTLADSSVDNPPSLRPARQSLTTIDAVYTSRPAVGARTKVLARAVGAAETLTNVPWL